MLVALLVVGYREVEEDRSNGWEAGLEAGGGRKEGVDAQIRLLCDGMVRQDESIKMERPQDCLEEGWRSGRERGRGRIDRMRCVWSVEPIEGRDYWLPVMSVPLWIL